jgi:hypothetical protein
VIWLAGIVKVAGLMVPADIDLMQNERLVDIPESKAKGSEH